MQGLKERARAYYRAGRTRVSQGWVLYRTQKTWKQWAIGIAAAVLVIAALAWLRSDGAQDEAPRDRVVTIASVATLSGGSDGSSAYGTVRSVTEAQLIAETGGVVKRVNAQIGQSVPAGFVIAELENSSEAAAVLQAEGAYDAAIAARSAQSLPDTQLSARDAYRSTYTSLDTAVETQIDTFFGTPNVFGPDLLINASYDESASISRERQRLEGVMRSFEVNQATAGNRTPQALLDEAESVSRQLQTFLNRLAEVANRRDSGVTASQTAALSGARAAVNGSIATISASRTQLRTGTISATAGADAQVKQALGSLRAAQAAFARTRIRATIGGTVNSLSVQRGQFVAAFAPVATIANNGALEIVAYVSEEDRDRLEPGMTLDLEGGAKGTVTTIAPALDTTTRQIEIRIGVASGSGFTNGQSVRIALPGAPADALAQEAGPILLPLSAVKLTEGQRAVFTVGEDGRIAATPVEIGDVVGDRITITSDLPRDLRIVTDARGLSVGQRVRLADDTAAPTTAPAQ